MNASEVVDICKPYSGLPREGLLDLYRLIYGLKAPGAVVECGVQNGGAGALCWAAAGIERDLWLFDSFQGLPRPTEPDGGRAFSKYAAKLQKGEGWCVGTVQNVNEVTAKVGGLARVHIVPGWVEDTLPDRHAEIGAIAVLHIDVDFYSPTQCALAWLYEQMSPGGLVIVDDYHCWEGCKKAVDEFTGEHGLTFAQMYGSPVYWRKEGVYV